MLDGRVRTEGISVPVGFVTFLGLRQSEIARKGGKYGDCISEWPEFLELNEKFKKQWPRYSAEKCIDICIQKTMAGDCGCTDTFEVEFSMDEETNEAASNFCQMTNATQSNCKEGIHK